MAVRPAVVSDIARIIDMVCMLRDQISGPVTPDPETIRETLLVLMASPHGIVLISDGGFIAGSIAPTIISKEWFAHELGWFAKDCSGLRLLRAFERWADNHGARVRLSTGSYEGTPLKLRNALQRRGYQPHETAWVK